jgi:hypothetical protein
VGRYIKLSCNYTYKCFNCGRIEVRVVLSGQTETSYERRLQIDRGVQDIYLVRCSSGYGNVREGKRSA